MKKTKSFSAGRIISLLVALLMAITMLPYPFVAADGSLLTNKLKYLINEPVMVTATEGKWVGVFKKGEDLNNNGYFYAFDVDGKEHNIYDETKGTRGATFIASIPGPMDLTVYLFADEGRDNILDTVNIHINSTTHTSSLNVIPEYKEGDAVDISVSSDERDAWVGIYEGTLTASDTFTDKGIESFYVCYAQSKGKTIEGLSAGKYTAVLFSSSKYAVDKVANFEIKSEDEPVTPLLTDKDVYDIEEPVLVTTNYYSEGAWAGLYEKGAAFSAVPIYHYALTEEQPQQMNILEGTAGRPEDYKAGEYTVALFADSGTENLAASKDITVIEKEKGTVSADKQKYKVNEPIIVTSEGGSWIGVYKSGENPETVKDGYFYRLPADGEPRNVYSGEKGNRQTSFIASIPPSFKIDIILFQDEGYQTQLDKITVQTVSSVDESILSAEAEYQEGDNVYIQASSNMRDAWVGIYSGVYTPADSFDSKTPVEKFYVAHKDNKGSLIGGLAPGYYTAVLFSDGKYTVDRTLQFRITGGDDPLLNTDKTVYMPKEAVYVTTNYYKKGAWVGLYLKQEWPASDEINPVYRYDLSPAQPQTKNLLEGTALRPSDYTAGEYVIALFDGNGVSNPVATKEITVKNPESIVFTEPDCEEYGYEKVTYDDGTSEYRVIQPLGHDFSEWTYDEEHRYHTRVCLRNTSHSESQWCDFDEGTVIEEATFLKKGTKLYTCSVCGGTYTEEYESDKGNIARYYGEHRYETSIKVAQQLKLSMGVEQFDAIILAAGDNYPDALSGAYMAQKFNAPILLISDVVAEDGVGFIRKNLSKEGTVYILGGPKAVSEHIENLVKQNYKVERIAGDNRFDTNLEILNKTNVTDEDILICTGMEFADSLSASAAKRPILLVGGKLTDRQTAFLRRRSSNKFYIIGGTSAVSTDAEAQITNINKPMRLAGDNRYETSVLIAKEFFDHPSGAILSFGHNFPDGLCGGPLAISENVPLVMTHEVTRDIARDYFHSNEITKAAVLGGTGLISDETVRYILAEKSGDEKQTFRIKYVLNGGSNTLLNPVTYMIGDEITLTDPTRMSYVFDGWYTDSSFSRKFEGFTPKTTGNITLYAKWKDAPLDITVTGMENMIWSWWYSPQVISTDDKVFWGFAENGGYSGIAEYDIASGKTKKTFVKSVSSVDDHNGVALTLLKDGRILSSFAGGHNKDNLIHIRISNEPYSVDKFDTEILLKSTGKTCYSQLLQSNGRLYLFYRVNNTHWAYRESADGMRWTDEVILITSDEQYYCKFTPTTEDGLFRMVMYANPSGKDTNIRMGFFNSRNNTMLNADRSTPLGNMKVPFTDFDILIAKPEILTQRMFDVAITAPESPMILYSTFSSSKTALKSTYYLYAGGTSTKICEGGHPLMNPKYQLGASFVMDNRIILARNENDTDYIELYSINGTAAELEKAIYSEPTEGSVRNARPIADINGKVILWHSGYYNEGGYTDFETDAKISFLP